MHQDTAQDSAPEATRAHRKLALVIVIAASVLAFFAIFAIWVNRQALNTDNWTQTSSKLLEDDAIRAQIVGLPRRPAVREFDVQADIAGALPPRAAPLAGPIAGGDPGGRTARRGRAARSGRASSSCGKTRTGRRTSSCWPC